MVSSLGESSDVRRTGKVGKVLSSSINIITLVTAGFVFYLNSNGGGGGGGGGRDGLCMMYAIK